MMKKEELNKLVGPAFEDLSLEEMLELQGSGDPEARTTLLCITMAGAASFTLGTGITVSLKHC